MNDATRTELTNLVQDFVISSDDYPADVDEVAYANVVAQVYDACLKGTINNISILGVPEYLRVLAELGYDTRNRWQICETIIAQLGGTGRLCAMVGTPRKGGILVDAENLSVTIRFKGCRKFDRVKVTLAADDTYTVHFMKFSSRTFELTREDKTEGAHADQLVSIFESKTGLYLSL